MGSTPKNYQELSRGLDDVLAKLQDPDVSIDDAVKLYETGQKLVKQIELYLTTAQNHIKLLTKKDSEDLA